MRPSMVLRGASRPERPANVMMGVPPASAQTPQAVSVPQTTHGSTILSTRASREPSASQLSRCLLAKTLGERERILGRCDAGTGAEGAGYGSTPTKCQSKTILKSSEAAHQPEAMRLAAVQSWRSRCSMSVTQYGLFCRTQDGSQPSVAFAAVRRQAIANAGPLWRPEAFLSPAHTKNRSSVEFEDTSRSVSSAPCARHRHPKSCEEYCSRALLRDLQSGAPVLVDEVPVMLLATAADVALPSIGMTFGAIYICTAVGLMLSGLVLHQTYRYFHLYPEDALYLKLMVGGLLVLDTLHSSTALHVCYYYLVQNYFFPENLAKGVWSIQSLTMETGIIVIVSHWFFARRLFFLADRKLLYLLGIGALLLGELSMCTVATVEIVKKGTFIAFQDSMWTLWAAFSIAVTVDVFCSIGLTYHLQRNRTGFKKTDSMVDVLMVYTINTGLITSLCTLGALVSAVVFPKDLIFTGVYVVASKLYTNSLLAVLNSRRSILEYGMACWDTASLGLQITSPRLDHSIRFAPFSEPHSSTFNSKGPSDTVARGSDNIFVKITTETVVKTCSKDIGKGNGDRISDDGSTLGRLDPV